MTDFVGYSAITGNFIPSITTGAICCNAQSLRIGQADGLYNCCNVNAQAQYQASLARIQKGRALALRKY